MTATTTVNALFTVQRRGRHKGLAKHRAPHYMPLCLTSRQKGIVVVVNELTGLVPALAERFVKMNFFRQKPRMTLTLFSGSYYKAAYKIGNEAEVQTLLELAPHLKQHTLSYLSSELHALHFEIFALALSHKIRERRSLIAESLFDREFIKGLSDADLWHLMGTWNGAVADSIICEVAEQQGYPGDSEEKDERGLRVAKVFCTEMRIRDYREVEAYNPDPEYMQCAARVLNRVTSTAKWSEGQGVVDLCSSFAMWLRASLDEDGYKRIAGLLQGFYFHAERQINLVSIKGV